MSYDIIGYRDMTFCSFWDKCKHGNGCFRALTSDVIDRANKGNRNICQYADRPSCFEEVCDE